ncbi:hypothetical protein [Clostridium beijerinckii]|uniref:hypothetical protein n=1 Tax=Clostridium beijerinckii TaxID=1520 RepID=UPI00156D7D63|nr:hypothetical protein [Clostridium beijerinckii]NRU52640.1 hypothetical protein [Clostridium beijerinckii]NYC68683.1 hypothetical protein [Clostridium beijerinckii]NYC91832.1 hypothetical protein [Clostridium beijerinckii]
MFNTNNTYSTSNNNLNINAITGTILKNYKDSFFLRFHLESPLGKQILNRNPKISETNTSYAKNKEIVVIQMMMCGDMDVIAELMWKEDFDKLYANGGTL